MIAVFGALKEEVAPLRKRMRVEETANGPTCLVYRGKYSGRELVLVQTGMGKERAETATRFILDRYPITSLVSLGFAGALDDKLNAGDVILYSVVHCAEGAADAVADLKASPVQSYVSGNDVLERAKRALKDGAVSFICEPGVSVRQVVLSPEDRGLLAEAHHAHVVDMESYWIAKIATEMGIPFVIIRSVSDTRHEKLLPFDQLMNEDGTIMWKATAAYFVCRPHHLAVVGRLYRNARKAQGSLVVAMDALICEL